MHKPLRDKKILITAGPTWIPIDRVRVISNISSGATGTTIARHAAKLGADVTLLLGPVTSCHSEPLTLCVKGEESLDPSAFGLRMTRVSPALKILRFKYFDELQKLIIHELRRKKYDIIIQGAAVSDYRLAKAFSGKIKSDKRKMTLSLKAAPKLINEIRKYAKEALLVMFKLEAKKSAKDLIDIAYKAMLHADADLVVANNIDEISENRHKAYIIDRDKKVTSVETKEALAKNLLEIKGIKRD